MRTWLLAAVLLVQAWSAARAEEPRVAAAKDGAAAPAEPPAPSDRLLALARVWATAKFFHPTLATTDIDWDRALVIAIPKVEAAKTLESYKVAIDEMLGVIGDASTRVVATEPEQDPAVASESNAAGWKTWPSPGVLEIRMAALLSRPFDFVAARERAKEIVADAGKARAMIIDLRDTNRRRPEYVLENIAPAFPSFDAWPTTRFVEHRGFRTQHGMTSGGYFSSFVTDGAKPPHVGPKTGPAHIVFVLDPSAPVPGYARALQVAGKGSLVVAGGLGRDSGDAAVSIALGARLTARVRLHESEWGPPVADVIPRGKDPMVRARELAKRSRHQTKRMRKLAAPAPLRPRDDLDYADTPYPSRELRMLAGIRLWAVIEHFLPYRYLIADWDAALRDALPQLAAAPDRDAYLRALRELAVRAGDGHINVYPTVRPPSALPPFEARLVEGKLAIVRVLPGEDAAKLGLSIGDVIEKIDGKPLARVLDEYRPITSGSTVVAREQRTARAALAGAEGSTLLLAVRDARGKLRDISVTRTKQHADALWAPSAAPHWKILAGNVGYVDLRELTVPEVDTMFRELAGTKALVLDMRGYPNGTAWAIAPRINVKRAKHGAQFLMPLVDGWTVHYETDARQRFLQPLPELPAGASLYTGKIVMLIDERAISQAEHTCLFFQEAAGATFVGSPTHGANGDVTVMRLPGGLRMSFTGQEVRHADGKQLQNVGIQPHVLVRPTLAGIRAGKDEVLDRALALIAQTSSTTSSKRP